MDNLYKGELQVVWVAPTGTLAKSNIDSLIYIVFSKPMVKPNLIGIEKKSIPFVDIEPAISGSYFWAGENSLLFKPDSGYFKDGSYKVTIRAGIKTTLGEPLNNDYSFEFTPRIFQINDFWAGEKDSILNNTLRVRDSISQKQQGSLYIETNYLLPIKQLKRLLSFQYRLDTVKYKIKQIQTPLEEKGEVIYRVKLLGKIPEGALIQLYYNRLPIEGRCVAFEQAFSVLGAHFDYDYQQLLLQPTKPSLKYLNILCTSEIDKKSCEGKILINDRVVPKNAIEVNSRNIVVKSIDMLSEHNQEVNIRVLPGLLDVNHRMMKQPYSQKIKSQPVSAYVHIPYGKVNYISKKNPFLFLEGLAFRSGRWDFFSKPDEQKRYYSLPFNFDSLTYPHIARSDLSQFKLIHGTTTPFYGKIVLDDRQEILSKKNSAFNFDKHYRFEFSSFGISVGIAKDSVLVIVTDVEESTPCADVEVVVRNKKNRVSAKSDNFGIAIFQKPFGEVEHQNENFFIELYSQEQQTVFEVASYKEELEGYSLSNSPYLHRATIFTDSSSYKPSDTILATILDAYSAKDSKNAKCFLELQRLSQPNRRYHRVVAEADKKGLWTMSYSLPQNLISGKYELIYQSGVSRGVIPINILTNNSSELVLEIDKPACVSGEKIEAVVTHEGLHDEPFKNLQTSIEVRQTILPYSQKNIPFAQGYVGPYDYTHSTKRIVKTVYCDDRGKSYFRLDSYELYRDTPRFPSRLEIVPLSTETSTDDEAAAKTINLYPSSVLIAAKVRGKDNSYGVRANRNFYIDYQLVSPDGSSLSTPSAASRIFLEISPMGKDGELLGLTGRMTKRLRGTKGSFKVKLYSAGAFFITLRTKDNFDNPVVTEFPLYVEGKKSSSKAIQIKPTYSYAQVGKEFNLWVNTPQSYLSLNTEGVLVKSGGAINQVIPITLNSQSQFIKVPINETDFPSVRFTLFLFPRGVGQQESAFSYSNYITAISSTNVFVKPSNENRNELRINGLDNLVANQSYLIDFDFSDWDENQNGTFTYGFIERNIFEQMDKISIEDFAFDYQFPQKNLTIYDIKSQMSGGHLDKTGITQWSYADYPNPILNKLFYTCPTINFAGKQKQQLSVVMPKEGDYMFVVIGMCDLVPFFKSQPLVVREQGISSLKVLLPKEISKREVVEGKLFLDFAPLRNEVVNGTIVIKKQSSLNQDSQKDTDGLLLSSNKFELNRQNAFSFDIELGAQSVGDYIVQIDYKINAVARTTTIPIRVVESNIDVTRRWYVQGQNELPFILSPFPKNKELSPLFSPSINLLSSSLVKMKWHQIIKILNDGVESNFFDNRISALFPYYQISRNFPYSNFGDNSITPAVAQKILNLIINMQDSNGAYPICIDKNYASDFYTTLRVADLLEFSRLPYYEYTIVWSLLQYLKLSFKGTNATRDSHYLRCYAAWVLSRFNENVVLVAKNLLEENRGSLAESSLAAMALIIGGRKYKIDVSEYLEQHLARVLKIYDPSLSALIPKQQESFYSYKEDKKNVAFGYDRPQNGAVEAALCFLFLQQLGGYQEESLRALEIMLEQDISTLNDMDASFLMRAFYIAHQKGFFEKLFLSQDNGETTVALRYGNDSWLELKQRASNLERGVYAPNQMPLSNNKKELWSILTLGSRKTATEVQLSLSSPVELIPSVSNGYSLLVKWFDFNENEIDGRLFNKDQSYQCHIYISSYSGTSPIVLTIPLSIHLFEIESVVSLCSDIKQHTALKKEITSQSIELTYSDLPWAFDEIVVTLKPKYNGTFCFAPIEVKNPFDCRLWAMSEGTLMSVSEERSF